MAGQGLNVRAVFDEALERDTPEERAAYLEEVCAGRPEVRREVESLLRALDSAGDFLARPALGEAIPPPVAETQALGPRIQSAGDRSPERIAPTAGGAAAPAAADNSLSFLQSSAQAGTLGRFLHYEVQQVLGKGGFGVVLRAIDEKLRRPVAIKVLSPQLGDNVTARRRFLREARAAAAIRNPHVVRVYGVAEQPVPHLVMEYVAGSTLQERIEECGALSVEEVLHIGRQAAEGLAAAHALGLIHRDVKPANILLEVPSPPTPLPQGERGERAPPLPLGERGRGEGERVRITDFGLAKAVDDVSLTQSGVITGTPLYMSPEQARGQPLDARSDLFSLGSVLYTLCTGQPPFRAANSLGVLKRVCEDTPRPIREINPNIPDFLTAIIRKLLAKNPGRRFQSAAEVADLLRQHLAHLRDPSLPAPPPLQVGPEGNEQAEQTLPSARPALRRRRWLAVGGLAALVAAGLAALPSLFRHNAPEGGTKAEQLSAGLPASPEQAEALAGELLKEREIRWKAVPAADLKSTSGALLTQRADKSILVSGTNAEADVYTLALTDLPPTVSALRLEVLRDPHLPRQGPGRHISGGFLLAEVVLYHAGAGADSPVTAVPIATGVADAADAEAPLANALDDDPATGWGPGGRPGQNRWEIFKLLNPLYVGTGDRLLVRLEHAPRGGAANLGRFRLAVREDPVVFEAERLLAADRSAGLHGFAALGAAYFCRADYSRAVEALARAVEAVPEPGPTELLLRALAHQELQQAELARPLYQRAMALLGRQEITPLLSLLVPRAMVQIEGRSPADVDARRAELLAAKELARLTAAIGAAPNNLEGYWTRGAWYACHAQWRDCAQDFLAVIGLDIGDREAYEVVAAAQILAGDPGPIGKLYDRLTREAFSTADDQPYWTCHIRCQVGLMRPGGVPLSRVPLAELDDKMPQAEEKQDLQWLVPRMQGDRALAFYRRGEWEQAVDWCGKAVASEEKYEKHRVFREQCNAQHFALRAMAEHRLGRHDDARQAFVTATRLIPAEVRALPSGEGPGTRPASMEVLSGGDIADWLIAEVRRREAEEVLCPNLPAFLKGEYRPSDTEERLTLAVACRARGLHRLAAGLYADAFAAEPKRAEDRKAGHRYTAACCAARAGAANNPAAPDKDRWRTQALRWLQEELAALSRPRGEGTPADRTDVRQVMQQWRIEPDFTRVRDPFWIAGQPLEERLEWAKLWAGVAALSAMGSDGQ